MTFQSPLRDLALQLREVAQAHPAYSQASELIRHMNEHLNALAYCEECHRNNGSPDSERKRSRRPAREVV